jgi:Oxidoreductase NAD-binding domain
LSKFAHRIEQIVLSAVSQHQPGQRAASHDDVQRRDGSPYHFRKHGREDQMIVNAENNYFIIHRQRPFEALRQSHSGKTPANKALKKLKPGDAIEAREKGGDFVLDHRRKIFVFIAGGIDITPFRAILLDLDRNRKLLNVQLLYANQDNDFPYCKELEALKKRHPEFRIDYVVNPHRIDEKSVPQLVPDMDEPVFYVSGPEPMVESLEQTLKKLSVPKKRIKTDFFPGYHWP